MALAMVAAAAPAGAESLAELLAAVAANARFPAPTRADVRIECQPSCAASQAILLGRGDTLYVEVKGGPRALVRPDSILVAEHDRGVEATSATPLDGTVVLLEDLAVFTPAALKVPQISDDGVAGVVVTGAPAGKSVYALLVDTIDRERAAIVKTQYYRDSISNLTKLRRDGRFVRVADHWRAGEVAVENLREGTTAHLTLAWRAAPETPAALFEASGLEHPSGLDWP